MGPYVIAAACGAGLAKLCSIKPPQDSPSQTLQTGTSLTSAFVSIPVSIAFGVSAKVATVAVATFYTTLAFYFDGTSCLPVAFALTAIGGVLTYAFLALCGPVIAAIIGIAASLGTFYLLDYLELITCRR